MVVSEILARCIWRYKYAQWLGKGVHPFGYIDREHLSERYRPGYKKTIADMLRDLESSGKPLSYKQTKQEIERHNLSTQEVAIEINEFGLKGPEFSVERRPEVVRILTIGDSCTFGPYIDRFSYPRQLEVLLNSRRPNKFEVINAGHLGYNLEQVLGRLDEWLLFEADIITIYIGWNRTILRADPRKNDALYEKFAIYRFYYHALVNRADLSGVQVLPSRKYDMHDPDLGGLNYKTFEIDLAYLRRIVLRIRERLPNTKIILLTLPGLYTTAEPPSADDLDKGYATAFSSNLAAWAVLSDRYNKTLKTFAKDESVLVCDLATYAERNFHPRGLFFNDSVHPSILGYSKIAEFLAECIKSELSK
jgi:lysophospholipase L1-like esterase